MKKSTKAVLLSGLVFPGTGQLLLKSYVRGTALIVVAFAALFGLISAATERAMTIVDRINSGDIALDVSAISAEVSRSSANADGAAGQVAVYVLIACWLFGMWDAHRTGVAQERQQDAAKDGTAAI